MIEERYHSILSEPAAFWAANCDAENIPEIIRCAGIASVSNLKEITFFVSEAFGRKFIENIQSNKNITLAATCVPTFESYQYKGVYQSIRPSTKEEEELQRKYMDAFTDVVESFGYSKESIFRSYFHQPSFAITFCI